MLFILEMANNHNGSVEKGKRIIDEFYKITQQFPRFNFAFKFQRRNLETLIHPDYQNRTDIPSIKRFKDTQLSITQLKDLADYARSYNYQIICTPFDEVAVDEALTLGLDYIKVASCSINDWPLWNKIAETGLPVIASTGGCGAPDISNVSIFCEHRNIDVTFLHCVGLYPTKPEELCLAYVNTLQRWTNRRVGFSSHEHPQNLMSVPIAIGAGACVIEKHVDIDSQTRNEYSVLPQELHNILDVAVIAHSIYRKSHKIDIIKKEQPSLNKFKRGAYLRHDVKSGDIITEKDLFFALPILDDNHITVFDCNKYMSFTIKKDMSANEALLNDLVHEQYNGHKIQQIHDATINILEKNTVVSKQSLVDKQLEISHHYGLEKFKQFGMCIITYINRQYCKKLLILKAKQQNPEHYHKHKTETFFVLSGNVGICVDGKWHNLSCGDAITIEPEQRHIISAFTDAVIEETSTQHFKNDSFYTDEDINNNINRKTVVYI